MKLPLSSLFFLAAATGFSQTTTVSSRADLHANDGISWSQLPTGVYNAPLIVTSDSGQFTGVDSQWTNLVRSGVSVYSPTPAAVNNWGVFGNQTHYIDNVAGIGLRIDFLSTVYAAGMRVGSNVTTPPNPNTSDPVGFRFHLAAFSDDGLNTYLGESTAFLSVLDNSNDTAPFLGIASTTGIGYVVVTMDDLYYGRSYDDLRLGIDDVSFRTTPAAVPEPASLLALAGGVGVILRRRRRS